MILLGVNILLALFPISSALTIQYPSILHVPLIRVGCRPPTHFVCTNGRCINEDWVCDGEDDCGDNSDEVVKRCRDVSCTSVQFKCNTTAKCIPATWVCDSEEDCPDGSDENTPVCSTNLANCPEDRFQCAKGVCIPLTWTCDGTEDCSNGLDERNCSRTCPMNGFMCGLVGKCIERSWVCDGDNDCGDHSDESHCPTRMCPSEHFQCGDTSCILSRWLCDGDYDCSDGSDEKNCSRSTSGTKNICQVSEYQCSDKRTCIPNLWVCNGENECPDGGDERLDKCTNATCRPDEFNCRNLTCIPGYMQCDGHFDCLDSSDEKNCEPTRPRCKEDEFDCGDGMCIPLNKVCDKTPDCPKGEDEDGSCGVNECVTKGTNGGCSHYCVDDPIGYKCTCPKGFRLVDNICEDINECEIVGSCSQKCINEKGSFKCECVDGYMKDLNNHTRCKAMDGSTSFLLSGRHDIRKLSLDHKELKMVVNNTKSAVALDFSYRQGLIFWSDTYERKIYKTTLDGSSENVVLIDSDLTVCDGLAVDWIYNNFYWTDTERDSICVATLDGKMRKTIIKDDLQKPRAIALNPLEGWMFWSDWGSNPSIEKAGLDGSHRSTVVAYDVVWPNGITLDLENRRLFWIDAKLDIICSVNYDGSGRLLVHSSSRAVTHPFSIAVFEDYIYWTDWNNRAVHRANKFDGTNAEVVSQFGSLRSPMVIHIYHPYKQPNGTNHCSTFPCTHFCLPAPQINTQSPKVTCACPDDLHLLSDRLTCGSEKDAHLTSVFTTSSTSPSTGKLKKLKPTNKHFIEKTTKSSLGKTASSHEELKNTRNKQSSQISEDVKNSGIITGTVIALIVLTAVIIGMFYGYKKYSTSSQGSVTFVNRLYGKTGEDHVRLTKDDDLLTGPL